MRRSSPRSPPPYPLPMTSGPEHSNEIEHRLTIQEVQSERLETRLSRLEKIVLALVAALNILAHDKLPDWAKGISLMLKAAM